MKSVLAILLVATAVFALSENEKSRLAMQNPDLFQGDITGFDPEDRNVHSFIQKRWPKAQVPFMLHRSVKKYSRLIYSAMAEYHKKTCIRFVPRTLQRNYILLFSGDGCYSAVGMSKGRQLLSLGDGCMNKGIIIHELGHAIGFFHEQNRSDRDKYLTIYWENILKGEETQFQLLTPMQNILYTTFDYDSIMLYGNYAFSKDGHSMTMVAKDGRKLLEPYEKDGLSESDVFEIKKMYKCTNDYELFPY